MIDGSAVRALLKQRPASMHKGQAGRVLIVAGQKGMAGAAVLAARGALYSGAGLVKISAPEELFDILQSSVTEAMCIGRDFGFGDPADGYDLSAYDAIAIGPGLGAGDENAALLQKILTAFDGPVVIDADGLNCLCRNLAMLERARARTVLTPHPKEADRLLRAAGLEGYNDSARQETALRLTRIPGRPVVLLKGSGTVIASGEEIYVNTTGNPGMATGGSGDVLTGIIVSLIAQGRAGAAANEKARRARAAAGANPGDGDGGFVDMTPLEAVIAAAYIHGLAGDMAAADIGQYGMTSADIADAVSAAIKEVTGF